jgi:hypothetical protein
LKYNCSNPKEAPTIIGNAEGLSEIRKQLVQMASAIKAIQDDLPVQIQAQVSAIVKAEFESFQKKVVA